VRLLPVCLHRVLGTPNEEIWPGVTTLQDWNEDFPVWPPLNVANFVAGFSDTGVDLIEVRQYSSA
jgi:hypothetical protein